MGDLEAQFKQAAEQAQSLPRKPDNETLLQLYGLYKQATQGDVAGKRPGGFDLVAKAKWDAWAKHKGQPTAAAMQAYVDLVTRLKGGK